MPAELTIGALSRRTGIPASTLRYYEREGLLEPSGRTEANYRLYSPEGLERLRFIRAAQQVGFTLIDIRTLLAHRDRVITPCREVSPLIEERLAHVEERLAEFRHVRRVLRSFLKECHEAKQDAACHVLAKLDPRAPGTARNRGRNSIRK